MSNRAWMSGIFHDSYIGDKQGIRTKYHNTEWEPPRHQIPISPPHVTAAFNKYYSGYALTREELPEAIALWNRGCFRRTKELFMGGFVYAVRGKLAEVISEFNLGENGSLVPFEIIQDDLKTPLNGKFFYVNWDGHKDTFLPEESRNVELFARNEEKNIEWWEPTFDTTHKDIALSSAALAGADIWIEKRVRMKLFISDRLAARLHEAKIKIDFRLMECRIVESS